MAIISRYNSKCKDCGIEYLAGEDIDTNGNKSPNTAGEMKDHWCKMGKNCQGAMQITVHPPTYTPPTNEATSKDPTPEQFLQLGKIMQMGTNDVAKQEHAEHIINDTQQRIAEELIKRSVIEKAMNDLGLKHPSRIAFIKDVLR